ncbi:MAG: histidine phosphatase family protein [Candidatus Woesearchaeota archaeon]
MNIQTTTIEVRRHAPPKKDPETKRSLDELTEDGIVKAEEAGKLYSGLQNLYVYSSGKQRTKQTGDLIRKGAGNIGEYVGVHNGLSLDFFDKLKDKPGNIAYGPQWIDQLMQKNPGLDEVVGREVKGFVKDAYQKHKGNYVLGVSHGPKVEIGYGSIIGTSNYGPLAADPLDGFVAEIKEAKDSGQILEARIKYKGGEFKEVDPKQLLGNNVLALYEKNLKPSATTVAYQHKAAA